MAIESPVSIGIISRLPEAQVSTAAFLSMMALSMWIESPVIDLLATSTTLGKNRRSYKALSRFTWALMLWVTAVHALVTLTPLYWLVTIAILDLPQEVAEAARVGMAILIPWSAFIGWRRYLQGLMIRHGQTKMVGVGTFVRMVTLVLIGVGLFFFAPWPSLVIAALALLGSVIAESLFIHWASRPVIRERYTADDPEDADELDTRKLLKFHLPLTATTMVMFLGGPVVAAALARVPNPVLMLAGWQVATSMLFLIRTITFALPEVIIALHRDAQTARILKRFCIAVGGALSGLLLLMAATGLDRWFFITVLGAEQGVAEIAHYGFLGGALMPLVGSLQAYLRGMLTAYHLTVARFVAVIASMSFLIALLAIGVWLQLHGMLLAGMALTIAMTAELAVLAVSWRRGLRTRGDATV
jgi:progressive ankylosis protein